MKSLCKILALGALAAASLGLSAQTIPASSLDSGSRATVAITPMTSSQVTSIVNSGIAAGAIAIPNQGGAYDRPWTSYFLGQTRCSMLNSVRMCATIDWNGGVTFVRHTSAGDFYDFRNVVPEGLNPIRFTRLLRDYLVEPLGHNTLFGTAPTDWRAGTSM